ncbi:ATP-binding protein [Natronomonas salina]|uniref:ATP-binding protein n=1 Tax=Natronomonas salina TaxID=1710540 RepID=UPI0015B51F16|nr:ATP-binding protein [Natronomonas salina]QLD88798.1 ATP-binding protein [Natronomonas salina]
MPETGAHLVEMRRYLRIQPAETALTAETVQRSLAALHETVAEPGRLGGIEYPTYEVLLAATGTTGDAGTRSLEWYVGVTPDDHLAATRRTLQQILPAAYDVHDCEASYVDLLNLPLADDYDPETAAPEYAPLEDWEPAGVEYHGVGTRPKDWQYPLEPMESFAGVADSDPDWPFARVFDGLASGDAPALFQLLVEPKPDWSYDRDARIRAIEGRRDLWRHSIANAIAEAFSGPSDREPQRSRTARSTATSTSSSPSTSASSSSKPSYRRESSYGEPSRDPSPTTGGSGGSDGDSSSHTASDRDLSRAAIERLEALERVDTQQSFTVNARAIALDTDADRADRTLRPLVNAYNPLKTTHYRVAGLQHRYGSTDANDLLTRLLSRELTTDPERLRHKIPFTPNNSPAIVAGPDALGALCITGGAALSSAARRALATTPEEKTGLPLPPREILNRYLDTEGMPVGHPRTADREPLEATVAIPPGEQSNHTAILGRSGAGKSVLAQGMSLGNDDATEGATIILDSKGDGGPETYKRMHYAKHGDLEHIYHFDCEELLPALPVLSIEPQLEAGIDRTQAVETVADHYQELIAGYMGQDNFEDASMAVDALEDIVKAMFDPIHGADAVSHIDIVHAAGRMHRTGEPPTVSDPLLQESLEAKTANDREMFDTIMGAVTRRLGKVTNDSRLTPLFTHTGIHSHNNTDTDDDDADAAPSFDFLDVLDEPCTVIIDTSGYHDDPRKLLTITLISELWRALKRRQALADPGVALPQVNLFVEEAADVASFDVLTDLLSKGRSFGVGVTPILQFPEQVREESLRAYLELHKDIGTHITGPLNDADDLASVYKTSDRDAEEMATRIASLDRGEWLVRLDAPYMEGRPRPLVCESRALPPGHPEGDAPLSDREETDYEARNTLMETRMYREYGLAVSEYAPSAAEDPDAGESIDIDIEAFEHAFDTTIPHTERLPDCVTYRPEPPYPLFCTNCETRHAPNTRGMENAITCCHDLASVDREDIPITNLDLRLTAAERRASDYSDAQLRFLCAVYMAHQRRFDADLEYDPVHDSMLRLQEYVGVDSDAVDALREDGLLKRDCTHPHRLYTVTPEGRAELQVGHREGVAHGDGKGDLSESSLHVAMIEAGCRCLRLWFVEPDDAPGARIKRYYEVDDGRLDAVVVDSDGDVVVTLEAELSNHDTRRAVPADFDKMAACDPDHAIWVVKNRAGAHDVLQALNDPAEGDTRVEKTYSENMRPIDFSIDTAGMTDVYTFQNLRDELDAP